MSFLRLPLPAIVVVAPLLSLSPNLSLGQTAFQRTYGGYALDAGASVRQTSDGGYISAGATGSFCVESDLLIQCGGSRVPHQDKFLGGYTLDADLRRERRISGQFCSADFRQRIHYNGWNIVARLRGGCVPHQDKLLGRRYLDPKIR